MEEDVHAQLCWIASLPDRAKYNFTKIRWSGILTTPFLHSEFEASGAAYGVNEYPPNVIWGVAWVKVDRRYSPTDILAKYESAQLKAWCTFFVIRFSVPSLPGLQNLETWNLKFCNSFLLSYVVVAHFDFQFPLWFWLFPCSTCWRFALSMQ